MEKECTSNSLINRENVVSESNYIIKERLGVNMYSIMFSPKLIKEMNILQDIHKYVLENIDLVLQGEDFSDMVDTMSEEEKMSCVNFLTQDIYADRGRTPCWAHFFY